ncbi:response regulator transcription factor [Xylanibacillus composti]|uniref:DNA-binding response regulator n=1 Tax=Xylanibacillus composti TaxID=1572762 RepID=A0A8J4M4G6_9BACL|nr:response regulator transcription factor [Xylanibacillus composti]GIQ70611.1 DNA-binding response regulator [Xylanibacillus composti]
MFTVMIVDDEPLIREGLQTIIDWEEQGFAIGAVAVDGKDALDKLERCSPHLMIVDIRMPGLDGLELMQMVREKYRAMRFLILSGYADFEYARKAMMVGADGYILKPVDEDELIEHLTAVRKTLEQQARENRALRGKEAWLQAILTEEDPELPPQDVLEQLDLHWPHYQVLLIQVADPVEANGLQPVSVHRVIAERVQQEQLGCVFDAAPYMAVLLRHSYRSELQLGLLRDKFQRAVGRQAGHLAMAAGSPVDSLRQIRHSYEEAVCWMQQRFFLEDDGVASVYTAGRQQEREAGSRLIDVGELANQLSYALGIGSGEGAARLLDQTAAAMRDAGMSELEVKLAFVRMLTTAIHKSSMQQAERDAAREDKLAWLGGIHSQPTLNRLLHYVKAHVEPFAAASGKDSSDLIVRQMIDLIQRHYRDHLKLESLGDVFNYNSAYLGKLFKSRTGEYFNTYLDMVRIEKAKELLEAGMKVYQAAEQVGYTNVDYFHTKFKKYTGVSPSAYKKKS